MDFLAAYEQERQARIPAGYRTIPGFLNYCIDEHGHTLALGRTYGLNWASYDEPKPLRSDWQLPLRLCPGDEGFTQEKNERGRTMNDRRILVHRAVYLAFVGPIPEGKQIDHIDGDPTNNHFSNLRVFTSKGTSTRNRAKLTPDDVRYIRACWDTCTGTKRALKNELAEEFSVSAANIEAIGLRKSWRTLP
jgi:hypothetical protein